MFFSLSDQLILFYGMFDISKGWRLLGPINVFCGWTETMSAWWWYCFFGFFFFFFSYNVRKPTTLAHRWFVLSLCPQGTLICLAPPLLHPWRSLQSLSSPRQGKARTCQRLLASLMMMTMMTFLQHPIASLPRQVLLQPLFLGISSEKECWLKKDMKVL